jgi:hypothetical protein
MTTWRQTVAIHRNEYHVIAFDPGGVLGWAHLVFHFKAFTTPRAKVLANLLWWSAGEFDGTETANLEAAVVLIHDGRYGKMPFHSKTDVVSEDFELTQMVGGHNLLSPVRINAVLEWETAKVGGVHFHLQKRQMRTSVTPERLRLMRFESPMSKRGTWVTNGRGKDMFAAMQHAVTWVRRVKQEANKRPWKLE